MINRPYNPKLEAQSDVMLTAVFVGKTIEGIVMKHQFIEAQIMDERAIIDTQRDARKADFNLLQETYLDLRMKLRNFEGIASIRHGGPDGPRGSTFRLPKAMPADFTYLHESAKALHATGNAIQIVSGHAAGVILGRKKETPDTIKNSVYYLVAMILDSINAERLGSEDFNRLLDYMADRGLIGDPEISDIIADARESVASGISIRFRPTNARVYVAA